MTFRLAFITGATSGIGKALAHLLASKGIPLFLTGRDEQSLKELKSTLKVPVVIHKADLGKPEERQELVRSLQDHAPDLVINNAGIGLYGETWRHTTQEELEIVEVNIAALTELCIEAARTLIQRSEKGCIVNISSAAAFIPFPTFAVYSASKAYVNAFSLALDGELSPHGIRVLTTCPGQIRTNFRKRASKQFSEQINPRALSPEKAALQIWKQIKKQRILLLFPWPYRVLIPLAKLLPHQFLNKLLIKSISNRYNT